ncbi:MULTISPECIES: hypothetical protein [Sulfurisphaera]|uniref:Uncharacterized protein n=2 Tax=Sulfurisphaera TaxID=69655 RepID=A0A7J9RQZ1_SULOH|nr:MULTISPECIES: hypothetical protein [Sulfurisphaera]MBB5252439.1 hypothetical protein [Sulfurisphaera ohwakuensis]HII73721.1 hypothetical protein [Sulfurisphaera tokodaii]
MKAIYMQLSLLLLSLILFLANIPYPVELAIAIPTLVRMFRISKKIKAKKA